MLQCCKIKCLQEIYRESLTNLKISVYEFLEYIGKRKKSYGIWDFLDSSFSLFVFKIVLAIEPTVKNAISKYWAMVCQRVN